MRYWLRTKHVRNYIRYCKPIGFNSIVNKLIDFYLMSSLIRCTYPSLKTI